MGCRKVIKYKSKWACVSFLTKILGECNEGKFVTEFYLAPHLKNPRHSGDTADGFPPSVLEGNM
jgi:hypothetical protein